MTDTPTNKFEGWAVVELFGHVREAGYVTTEYFGSGALFRVDVPELPAREVLLRRPEWIEGEHCGAGTKVARTAVSGRTRYIGPSAIYALNPCSQDAAFAALESMTQRETKVVELAPAPKQLIPYDAGPLEEEDEEDDESGDYEVMI